MNNAKITEVTYMIDTQKFFVSIEINGEVTELPLDQHQAQRIISNLSYNQKVLPDTSISDRIFYKPQSED